MKVYLICSSYYCGDDGFINYTLCPKEKIYTSKDSALRAARKICNANMEYFLYSNSKNRKEVEEIFKETDTYRGQTLEALMLYYDLWEASIRERWSKTIRIITPDDIKRLNYDRDEIFVLETDCE